jgi:hypothetical protein
MALNCKFRFFFTSSLEITVVSLLYHLLNVFDHVLVSFFAFVSI